MIQSDLTTTLKLDSGYAMCLGAAAAKKCLTIVVRDAINAGGIPGPQYLANTQEMAPRDGDLVPGITDVSAI
ncbi:hypothetical protein BDW59DRAFT_166903 [Aspergillus cavernicola]|uniref:Uncharacterized protein n=1 Tax=Aspergillus cavernicola TaxID=176166 RepID=A0ABR4HIE6_9EURO